MKGIEFTPSFLGAASQIAGERKAAEAVKDRKKADEAAARFRQLVQGYMEPKVEAKTETPKADNEDQARGEAPMDEEQIERVYGQLRAEGMGSLIKTLYDQSKEK